MPLGVNGVQNEPQSFTCSLVGAHRPFPASVVAGLYKDQGDYVNRARVAARAAEAEGFLLPEDAVIVVNAAAAPIFVQPAASSPPD